MDEAPESESAKAKPSLREQLTSRVPTQDVVVGFGLLAAIFVGIAWWEGRDAKPSETTPANPVAAVATPATPKAVLPPPELKFENKLLAGCRKPSGFVDWSLYIARWAGFVLLVPVIWLGVVATFPYRKWLRATRTIVTLPAAAYRRRISNPHSSWLLIFELDPHSTAHDRRMNAIWSGIIWWLMALFFLMPPLLILSFMILAGIFVWPYFAFTPLLCMA